MNLTSAEGAALATEIVQGYSNKNVEAVVAPPYTALDRVSSALKGSGVALASQDLHWEKDGAFTGKISTNMLKEFGIRYAIIGHSEQRTYFHETNDTVNAKVKRALDQGIIPIICVGETLGERDGGKTFAVVESHVRGAYWGLSSMGAVPCVIAYEPVWAIGTGRNATPEQAQEVHGFIRKLLGEMYSKSFADSVRILYGGSMKPDNAKGLLQKPDIDGGLIGGASLKGKSFLEIIAAAG